MNKEFSDALGFKLLNNFIGFMQEYPVEGAQIQKICNDSFTANCFKCYPIIANAGVDPATYTPKNVSESNLRNELRKQFPIRKIEPESEPEVTEIPKPTLFKPCSPVSDTSTVSIELLPSKPEQPQPAPLLPSKLNPFKPSTVVPAKPAEPRSPLKTSITYVTKCQKCHLLKQSEDLNAKKVQELRGILNKEMSLTSSLTDKLQKAQAEIKKLQSELSYYRLDPEFQAILDYQKAKRQRRN